MESEIYTDRLMLRKFKEDDFVDYCDILKQDEVSKWLGSGKKKSEEDVKFIMQSFEKHWNENGYGVWAIINKQTKELMGHCGFNILQDTNETELLYAFGTKFWGKGYATEAGRECIKFIKENFNLKSIVALAYIENNKSSKVIEKLGFNKKGMEKHFGVELLYYELIL